MAAAVGTSPDPQHTIIGTSPPGSTSRGTTGQGTAYLYRTTSSPLPRDAAAFPSDYIEHLLLITSSIIKASPPPSLRSAYGPTLATPLTVSTHNATQNPSSDTTAPVIAKTSVIGSNGLTTSAPATESLVTLPLPRYHYDAGDDRTVQIEANIGTMVERLWKAENQLEAIAQSNSSELSKAISKSDAAAAAAPAAPATADVSVTTISAPTSSASSGAAAISGADYPQAKDDAATSKAGRRSSLANFPYPLSQDHPQSSTFPLSYPLGMGSNGPVLLTSGSSSADPESAVGAFERYSDESGLSAQEELRLLKAQVQDIARVCKAVAFGDLSQHITVPVQGHVMVELKDIINQMVDRLSIFATEVTRVSLEVGTEGMLGGQVEVEGVEGRWRELKDVVNRLAANLTTQVREVATVTKAVARGDLSKKIEVEAKGEILELKLTINVMVDQLRHFANEVTRVSREVGSQGQLGGQAGVPGVEGVWKELTVNVNRMCSNLTEQVRSISVVTTAVAKGDLTKTIDISAEGEMLQLKDTVNSMVGQLRIFASEVVRMSMEVGTYGKLGGQAHVPNVEGTWKDLTENVNKMADNLTSQVREIARVTKCVAEGVLTEFIEVDVKGEILDLKVTVNNMVRQLKRLSNEIIRVSVEVGTEGRLGGQANVDDVKGQWQVLTERVNMMASNLTTQVREIATVTTAVACGDLSKTINVEVSGEFLGLKITVNNMVDSLRTFSTEVTRVAKEVGTEGRLGGKATVTGVGGTWKDLTESVNTMAANLTLQVRSIAEATTAVARGDLTKKVTISVSGEILDLTRTINNMIDQVSILAHTSGINFRRTKSLTLHFPPIALFLCL